MKYFLISLAIIPTLVHGQVLRTDFGQTDPADVHRSAIPGDSVSGAVMLFAQGIYEIGRWSDGGYAAYYSLLFRIKILNETALALADVSFPYFSEDRKEQVVSIRGSTYNADSSGLITVSQLDAGQIFDDDADGSWHLKKFSMPQVRVGSVIEYEVVLRSEYLFSLRPWFFQQAMPVVLSELVVSWEEEISYNGVILNCEIPLERQEEVRTLPLTKWPTYRLTAHHVPALAEEPFVASMDSYRARAIFQLNSVAVQGRVIRWEKDWEEMGRKMLSSEQPLGKEMRPDKAFEPWVATARSHPTNPTGLRTELLNKLWSHCRWNGNISKYPELGVSRALKVGSGNSADLNMAYYQLLATAGYEVYPVLISTRSYGLVQKALPIRAQFNQVIVAIVEGGDTILIDAAAPEAAAGMLPDRDLNHWGLLLDKKGTRWVEVEPQHAHELSATYRVGIDTSGSMTVQRTTSEGYYQGFALQRRLERAGDTATFFAQLLSDIPDIEDISDIAVVRKGPERWSSSCQFEMTGSQGKQYLYPFFIDRDTENPFPPGSRSFAVDLASPLVKRISTFIVLPENYTVEALPKPATVRLPDGAGSFQFAVQVEGQTLLCHSEIRLNRYFFAPDEYATLREWYDNIVQKHAEPIILKRTAL